MNTNLQSCRYSLFALSELHRLGFSNIRAMPYFEGRDWNLLLGDESLFDIEFGSYVPDEKRSECILLQPTLKLRADDSSKGEPWEIAEDLIDRLPRKFEFTKQGATPYSNWFLSLVAYMAVRPNVLPWVSSERVYKTIWINTVSPEARTTLLAPRKFQNPPSGTYDPNAIVAVDPEIAVAQPLYTGTGSLIWPTTRSHNSTLDEWYENNAPSDRR